MSKYDFSTLSPLFESFGSGRDLGVDFRFSAARGGNTVVQVKHYTSGFGSGGKEGGRERRAP